MDDCSSSSSSSHVGHDLVDISSPMSSAGSPSALGTVLVAGCTGFLGQYLTAEAVGQGWDVHALVRLESKDDPRKDAIRNCFNSLGVKLVDACYDDHESLVRACCGVDVVLSCIGPSGIEDQLKLIAAARDAGTVKRFVPSEFGAHTSAACNSGIAGKYGAKRAVQEALEKAGLGYMYVTSYCLTSFWGPGLGMLGRAEPPVEAVEVLGDGTAKGIFVDEMDVARFTIRALSDPRTLNRTVHIRPPDNVLSQNDLISLWELKSGFALKREYIPTSTIDEAIKGTDDPCASALLQLEYCMFVLGNAKLQDSCDLDLTELYPHMPYIRVADYLDNFLDSHAGEN